MNIHNIDNKIISAINNALQGELFESLRGITISYQPHKLEMIAYIDGEITEEALEHMDSIDTYFLSHMPENFKSDVKLIRCDIPKPMQKLQQWIYLKT